MPFRSARPLLLALLALLALHAGCTPTVEGPAELRVVSEDLPLRLTQEIAKRATEGSPGRFPEVERDVRSMLSRSLHRTPENLRKRALYLETLGRLHAEQGDFADAEAAYRDSVEAWRALPAPDAEAFANALVQLAGIHYRLNDYARASAGYAEAISREEVRLGADHDDLLGLLSIQAGLELKLGHAAEAERLLRRQLETIVRIRGVDRREAASVMDHLAEALSLQERRTEAAELRQKAKEIRRKLCDEC